MTFQKSAVWGAQRADEPAAGVRSGLAIAMKQAHWNVKGPSFIGLHELFDKVDEAV